MIIVNLSQNRSNLDYYISKNLLDTIKTNLKNNKKSILYLNKRWNFSSLVCQSCSYYYKCKNCDIALSVHENPDKLVCHTCWASWNLIKVCIKCGSDSLKKIWVWTKKIEESLKKYFQKKSTSLQENEKKDIVDIFRFDLDSTKSKKDKDLSLSRLEKADIIIATKMITTGFDFKNIWVIAVVLAEQEFSFPSYDCEENAYIRLKQLIGRWSRLWEKTQIIIQTFIPDNPMIKSICEKNYKNFFLDTLKERKLFNYPPFVEMVVLEYRNKSETKALNFMLNLKNKLDLINDKGIEIILNKKGFKKYAKFHIKIILKWYNLRSFIKNIEHEILRNSDLTSKFW